MKILRNFVIVFVVSIITGGCAAMSGQPSAVMLQNPETMEFGKCEVDQWGTKKSYAKYEECIEEYKQKGYIIWDER